MTGHIYLGAGTTIEEAEGEADVSLEMIRWGDALHVIRDHRDKAASHAKQKLDQAGMNAEQRWRWRDIGRRIKLVMDAAEVNARAAANPDREE